MTDLNGGHPYVVQGFFAKSAPDDLGLPLAKPAEGDTVAVRDLTGQTHFKFIAGAWCDVGFVPRDRY
jgi:hypothetical protein